MSEYTLDERTSADGTVIKTVSESYDEGFRSGLLWPNAWNYIPGGPFVYGHERFDDVRMQTFVKASKAAAKAWNDGWAEGNRYKQVIKKYVNLPSWDDVNLYKLYVSK